MVSSLADGSVHGDLARVRDVVPSGRNTAGGGALLRELYEVCLALGEGTDPHDLKEQVARSQIVRKPAFKSRTRIWGALSHRYFEDVSSWQVRGLVRAVRHGMGAPEFVSLAYLYYALRDRLTFDFVTGVLWQRWQRQVTPVGPGDFLAFLDDVGSEHAQVKAWKESTRRKLAGNTLSALRDFGLLKGVRKRVLQRPAVAPETVFHLLATLDAEGRRGRAVLDSPDWRLFLWSGADVVRAVGELAQKGWVRFEKGGRTVILQLTREPEVLP